jgi:hypothetical protein
MRTEKSMFLPSNFLSETGIQAGRARLGAWVVSAFQLFTTDRLGISALSTYPCLPLPSLKPSTANRSLPAVRRWLDWPWQVRWGMLLAYAGLVAWVSLAPAETFARFPTIFPHQDKAVHFLYGVMVSRARWAMAGHWTLRPAFLVVVAGAITYGSLMEVLQGMMVNYHRSFEFGDLSANSLGSVCFWWLFRWMFVPSPAPSSPVHTAPDRPAV